MDVKKLSYLRIISGAFPTESFHVDVNNDDRTVIVPIARQEEMENAVRNLIISFRTIGMGPETIRTSMSKNELPVSKERFDELLTEVFHG